MPWKGRPTRLVMMMVEVKKTVGTPGTGNAKAAEDDPRAVLARLKAARAAILEPDKIGGDTSTRAIAQGSLQMGLDASRPRPDADAGTKGVDLISFARKMDAAVKAKEGDPKAAGLPKPTEPEPVVPTAPASAEEPAVPEPALAVPQPEAVAEEITAPEPAAEGDVELTADDLIVNDQDTITDPGEHPNYADAEPAEEEAPAPQGVDAEALIAKLKQYIDETLEPIRTELKVLDGDVTRLYDFVTGKSDEQGKPQDGLVQRILGLEGRLAEVQASPSSDAEVSAKLQELDADLSGLYDTVTGKPDQPGLVDSLLELRGNVDGLGTRLAKAEELVSLGATNDAKAAQLEFLMDLQRPELVELTVLKNAVLSMVKYCGAKRAKELVESVKDPSKARVSLQNLYNLPQESLDAMSPQKRQEFEKTVQRMVTRAEALLGKDGVEWNKLGGDV